ncbi:DUF503 family protein [Planococcaceae bacterium Storch 2/2-2]|nr:DUF503 family protein [Planococcaceae bacterium Storch 2/2-2]
MIVYAECSFFLPDVHSLKEKRSIVQKMIQKAKNRYNVSIAELDDQDVWQRTVIGIVAVSSSGAFAQQEVERTIRLLETAVEWEMTDWTFENY